MILDGEKVYTIGETAQRLRVTPATVYRYRDKGLLAIFKHAGKNYVKESWIREYFQRRADQGARNRSKAERATRARSREVG